MVGAADRASRRVCPVTGVRLVHMFPVKAEAKAFSK